MIVMCIQQGYFNFPSVLTSTNDVDDTKYYLAGVLFQTIVGYIEMVNPLTAKSFNRNFHPLEVVSR